MNITDTIHYVGVNDRNKHLFEGLWPIPYGVSYNSYIIDDERVALVDTVDAAFFDRFLVKIKDAVGTRPVDYLIINHMEPDHSGSIKLLRAFYPDMTLVGNKQTLAMVNGFYGETGNVIEVKDGDTLCLGRHTLSFHLIPMVHWPETMVTYDRAERLVFSGDAFGCFGALNGGLIDEDINSDIYWGEMERYYSCIVGKYGAQVQRALAKLSGLEIDTICPTHGPVWRAEKERVVSIYDRLSKYEAVEGVVVAYASMYGNTEQMAETIAETLSKEGIRNVVMHNLSKSDQSYVLTDIFRYKGLVLGAPTYNGSIFPQMEALMSKLEMRELKNRLFACFGSFTWAGQAVKRLAAFAEKVKYEVVADPVEMKQGMDTSDRERAVALAKAMADRLKNDRN